MGELIPASCDYMWTKLNKGGNLVQYLAHHMLLKNVFCGCTVVIDNELGDWQGNKGESWERCFISDVELTGRR